ncbi:MAG: hydrogenase formation protein HypD [Clostridia bacterium]|nr:hydrogenase formation protein HypD [Clostridia bacterium]
MPDLDGIKRYLREYDGESKIIMEVCGTHTASVSENGIADMLSPKIKLISGPGCPVCVTVAAYIDRLIELAMEENTTVISFGDMLRVTGSRLSLRDAAAVGGSVKIVYSPFEAISLAKASPERRFVFAAVGFETTTPIYALMSEQIINEDIKNLLLLTALKTMPAAIRAVSGANITGFLAPGHVGVITGHRLFEELARELGKPFVTAGFKGEELLAAIYALTKLKSGAALNLYPSAVTYEGNVRAREITNKYFEPCRAAWRGLGIIDGSGMKLRDEYSFLDIGSSGLVNDSVKDKGCRCGDVITGRISPRGCPLFGRVCTPDTPCGACMVSTEGSCFHYYINGRV